MKIQLVIGEKDVRYLDQIQSFFERHYGDQIETISFTNPEMMSAYLCENRADVLLVSETFGFSGDELMKTGSRAFAFFSDRDGKTEEGFPIIGKYKKPDLIYKNILNLYAEGGGYAPANNKRDGNSSLILVLSFSGGVGSSTIAAVMARKLSAKGSKTLYLNLERSGSTADFFSGSGSYTFEDVIYALKSRNSDLVLKLESCVRNDSTGVLFYESVMEPMYMLELSLKDQIRLLETLKTTKFCENIVADFDFVPSSDVMALLKLADQIIVVNDGSVTANTKFMRGMNIISVLEEQSGIRVKNRMKLVYNKFSSSKSSTDLQNPGMPVAEKIPPIKHATTEEIVGYLADHKDLFGWLR